MRRRSAVAAVIATALASASCARAPQHAAAPASDALVAPHDPRDPAQLSVAAGRLSVRFRAVHGQLLSARLLADTVASPMSVQLVDRGNDLWRGTLPEGTRSYRIEVRVAGGVRALGPFTAPAAIFRAVPWVGGAVGYQVFPERFANGDPSNDSLALSTDEYAFMDPAIRGKPPTLSAWDAPPGESHCCHQYYGGDLQGIRDHLAHLDSLGVTLLYLNPIWSSGSAHGYDTWDYRAVEPSFGDETLLRSLLREANARGIRVMWDFVPNHVGVGNAAFRDALARGTASEHWDWFSFKLPQAQLRAGDAKGYATFVGIGAMPKLAVNEPAVRDDLLDVVRKWTAFGFAGIRVDVPWEVTDAARFFPALRRAAKAIDPDVYLVGEVWQRAPEWLQGDRFDAMMNYAVGQDALERFATGAITGDSALRVMARVYAEYPEASTAMQFNVISTHDNSRLLTKMGGGGLGATPGADALARQRLASAMLFALPGVAMTFQGDECAFLGVGGGGSGEQNRYPMQWGHCDRAMFMHYWRLGRLKRGEAALKTPVIRLDRGTGSLLTWFRGEPGPGELLAVFNAAGTSTRVALPVGRWHDAVSNEDFDARAPLGPFGWRYLRRVSAPQTRP